MSRARSIGTYVLVVSLIPIASFAGQAVETGATWPQAVLGAVITTFSFGLFVLLGWVVVMLPAFAIEVWATRRGGRNSLARWVALGAAAWTVWSVALFTIVAVGRPGAAPPIALLALPLALGALHALLAFRNPTTEVPPMS